MASFLPPTGPVFNVELLRRIEGMVATAVVVLDPHDEPRRAGSADSLVRVKVASSTRARARPR